MEQTTTEPVVAEQLEQSPPTQGTLDSQEALSGDPQHRDVAPRDDGSLQGIHIEITRDALVEDDVNSTSPSLSQSSEVPEIADPSGTPPQVPEVILGDDKGKEAALESPVVCKVVRNRLREDCLEGEDSEVRTENPESIDIDTGFEKEFKDILENAEEFLNEPVDPLLLMNDNSAARLEWIRQKKEHKTRIGVFDKLMMLLGRENVKAEFLSMKAAIDARKARNETEYDESIRFEVEGRAGTGRDTIRRLYRAFRKTPPYRHDKVSGYRGRLRVVKLEYFTEDELHEFLKRALKKRSMRVEGLDNDPDLYTRILAKRIARRRGSDSFRNREELDAALDEACDRQADRLQKENLLWPGADNERANSREHLFFLTKEDLLGLPPPDIRQSSNAYQKLQMMKGLEGIKKSVEELMDLALRNYRLEMRGKTEIQFSPNKIFMGPPGSGKTTFAKLFGQIVVDLGLVSGREVVVKGPTDFFSQFVSGSEEKTRNILDETRGKVLIIDNAHGLSFRSKAGQEPTKDDETLSGIHDVFVEKTSTEPGQDRCIILVGYTDQMHDLLSRANPGLRSRFPIEEAFQFPDYELHELMEILKARLSDDGIEATEQAKLVASRMLARARDRPGFGNGREVHNLVNRARAAHKDGRPTTENGDDDLDELEHVVLEPADFDPHWEREWGSADCKELFKDFVGFKPIVAQFQGYQQIVAGMRLHEKDPRPHIPFTFVFKGPPGTGKTTTARKVGQIFFDMGFLATDEVIECSASDLIGQHVGHTASLVQSWLDRALGKMLFIDEAYRLVPGARGTSSGSSFEEEAIGELVDGLTKKKYIHKIVVILAGYGDDMDILMKSNRGLRGRFAAEVVFPGLSPKDSLLYLGQLLGKIGITILDEKGLDETQKEKVYKLVGKLSRTRDWSNGRDIETLANTITGHVYREEGKKGTKAARLILSTKNFIIYLQDMLRARLAGELIDRE